ncbi:MAG: dihydrodipicolinate reductase [uncultured bacterium]|nr:MAG: dihydrodipicolinate reductase [uncultured bacterium]
MTQNKIPVIITGVAGRMGKTLATLATRHSQCILGGATEQAGSALIGQDVATLTGSKSTGLSVQDDLRTALPPHKKGVIIDFTAPRATLNHLKIASLTKTPIVIGTTGFEKKGIEQIKQASKKVPIVMAPNMSLGVNTLFVLTQLTAQILGDDYDIEVFEAHHKLKKDAPSGTAVKLAQILAETTARSYPKDFCFERNGLIGERTRKEIGMQVLRGGDIVGEHTIYFCGMGERIELTHRATSRDTFALGALKAAAWLARQKPGLYDMKDVLGLKTLKLKP